MLRFDMDLIAADLVSRTIEGVVVPYDEVGRIAGVEYRFVPGSITAARARTPLLVDHDRGQPVGVLAELVDTPSGAVGRFRVDQTPAGDTALVQAASGSRGALSVGAEVVTSRDVGGVVEVTAGLLHEVSLLALGAFPSASVSRVAAELASAEDDDAIEGVDDDDVAGQNDDDDDEHDDDEPNPDQTELELEHEQPDDDDGDDDDDDAEPDPEEGSTMQEASAAPSVILAASSDRPSRELLAGELVAYIVRAQHGEPDARRYLEAALLESISTDVSGLLPPTYERTVIGGKSVQRPLYDAFTSRPLPGVGLNVNKPAWTTYPDGEWADTVDADATSTKVVIGSQVATVQRWDWAGAIPWVVVQRSDPSIVDEIYGEAVQDWYLDVEAKIYGEVSTASPGVATSLGAAIAEFYVASGNARSPDLIIMAPDVWGAFADAGAMQVAIGLGSVDASPELVASFAGIRAVTSGTLPPGETVLCTRRAVDARVTTPVRLTANAIGALNVELAVVGEGLFDTDYPREMLKFAGITPTIAQGGGGSSRSSRSS
jgi:HK97 family phage prohead protease